MKKIIVADTLKSLLLDSEGVPSRADLSILWVQRAEDMFSLHKEDRADLLIADLEMPGMPIDELCMNVRSDENLQAVSIIVICPDSVPVIERVGACGPNSVMVRPVDPGRLFRRIAELLDVADRADMREIVGVDVRLDLDAGHFFCVSLNISSSGMLLETGRTLAVGDRVQCSFVLNYPVTLQAEVARTEGESGRIHFYGLRFTDVDDRSRSFIEEFIKRRLRMGETI